jgi:hypothetical protein
MMEDGSVCRIQGDKQAKLMRMINNVKKTR